MMAAPERTRVLVADGDRDMRQSMVSFMANRGYGWSLLRRGVAAAEPS